MQYIYFYFNLSLKKAVMWCNIWIYWFHCFETETHHVTMTSRPHPAGCNTETPTDRVASHPDNIPVVSIKEKKETDVIGG